MEVLFMYSAHHEGSQLKNLINFSVAAFPKQNPELQALWENKGNDQAVSEILNPQSGILMGHPEEQDHYTQYDLIDALKACFRDSTIFKGPNPFIESFVKTIEAISQEDSDQKTLHYQKAMDNLIQDLARNDQLEKSYCLFQFLYIIRHIFKPKTSDEYCKCALVIGPVFQEAFGKEANDQLIAVFYHAFAHIIADERYDEDYQNAFRPMTSEIQSLGKFVDLSENAKSKPAAVVSEKDNQASDASNKFDWQKYKLTPEQIQQLKHHTKIISKNCWHFAIIASAFTWKWLKIGSRFAWKWMVIFAKKSREGFIQFKNSEFYANMKAKILKKGK